MAAALVTREAELLQAVAAAASLSEVSAGGSVVSAISRQQQQQVLLARAASGDLAQGQLVWDGDVAALVNAVLAGVGACTATNQWARIEQLLDAAADALGAAAAVNGVGAYGAQADALEQQQKQLSNGGNSTYSSGEGSEAAVPATQQQHQQEGKPSSLGRHREGGNADGWRDEWSEEEDGGWQDPQQPSPAAAAAVAAAEPLRAALLQYVIGPTEVQQLQVQLEAMRGQVRAARLLTKHGCCVSIGQVSAANSTDARGWMMQLLGRAQR